MQRRTLLLSVASGAIVSIAGCLGDDGVSEDAEIIEVRDNGFYPPRLEIEPGTTVVWEPDFSGGRTMGLRSTTFDDDATEWEFEEDSSSSTEYTFEEEGVYHVYENVMTRRVGCGAILVGDVEQDGSLPCE